MGGSRPDSSRSSHPSWRSNRSTARSGGWRQHEKAPASETAWRFKLVGYLLALLCLLAVFFVWLLNAPRATPFQAIAWTNYADPLPPNALSQEDVERFGASFQDRNISYRGLIDRRDNVLSLKDSLVEFLRESHPGGPNRRWRWSRRGAVIIYLSVHGAVDETGEPCLLAEGHDPLDSKTWIPVRQILSLISANQRLRDATKIVILDANRMDCNWGIGLLHQSFAERLVAVVTEARLVDPHLFMINSTRVGQHAWGAPEISGSPLGYFVAAGLRGAADQSPKNGQVSLLELYAYLQTEVDRFALHHRGSRQQPLMIPEQVPADVMLTYARPYQPLSPIEADPSLWKRRHEALNEFWKRYSQFALPDSNRLPVYSTDPLTWSLLNRQTVRVEQTLVAGKGYDFDAELTKANTLLSQLVTSPTIPSLRQGNIPLAEWLNRVTESQLQLADATFRNWRSSSAPLTPPQVNATLSSPASTSPPTTSPITSSTDSQTKSPDSPTKLPTAALTVPLENSNPSPPETQSVPPTPPNGRQPQTSTEVQTAPDVHLGILPATAAAWKWLSTLGPDLDRDDVQLALKFIEQSNTAPHVATKEEQGSRQPSRQDRSVVEPFELRWLRLTETYLPWKQGNAVVAKAIQAESAGLDASVGDVRTLPWVTQLLGECDQELRFARDELLVGNEQSLRSAEERWSRLIGPHTDLPRFVEIQRLKQSLAAALRWRDEACTKLPELVRWRRTVADSRDMAPILELIHRVHEIGSFLNHVPAEFVPAEITRSVNEMHAQGMVALEQLLRFVDQRSEELQVEDAIAADDISDLEHLLQSPLARSNARETLRRKYLDKLTNQAIAFQQDEPNTQDSTALNDSDSASLDGGPELSADTATDPILELLRPIATATSDSAARTSLAQLDLNHGTEADQRMAKLEQLEKMGGEVRRLLTQLPAAIQILVERTNARLEQSSEITRVAETQFELSQADHMARCASGILGSPLANDPCRSLISLDSAYFLLWQANRSLLDFWGDEGSVAKGDPQSTARLFYFASAAEEYLNSAVPFVPRPKGAETALREKMAKQIANAQNWELPAIADSYLDPDEPYLLHSFPCAVPPDLPRGIAAYYIADSRKIELPLRDSMSETANVVSRRGVDVSPPAGTSLPLVLQVDQEWNGSTTLKWNSYYRGHFRSSPFHVVPASGVVTEFVRPQYGKPTIQVKATSREVSQILFVLDCSYSMRARTEFEGRSLDRLYVARKQLDSILDNMGRSGANFRVGLLLYGHRAGWDRSNKIRRKPGSPPNLHPGADVQGVLTPPKPFVFRDASGEPRSISDDIRKITDGLEPWGETPLYFAIRTALQSFDDSIEGPRRIVVITDGVDEQSPDVTPATARTLTQNVRQALDQSKPTQLDIILFGNAQDFQQDKIQELKALAETGRAAGGYYDARSPSALLDSLQASLFRMKFTVQKLPAPSPVPPTSLRFLGDTWRVDDFDQSGEYAVMLYGETGSMLANSTVRLEGGEAIQLEFDRASKRLSHHRFRIGERLPIQENMGGCSIVPHVPELAGNDVTLRVSIQNQTATEFSPRPRQIWAEVRPSTGRGPVYYFQDAVFEENVPVPVLRFECKNFPATSSELRLWFTFQSNSFPEDASKFGDTGTTQQFGSAKIEWKATSPTSYLVVETHGVDRKEPTGGVTSTGTLSDFPLRIQLSPSADSISRRYMPEALRVRHVFSFATPPSSPPFPLIGPTHDSDWIEVQPIEFHW